ncbi:MAG: 16S rRNA (cytosine(967)-C(5))-methyltransferase RsmB [Trichloromonadaceae bacterium]
MKPTDPRTLAFEVLTRVAEGAYADLALDAALELQPNLDPRDRALTTELVYGVLRQQGKLDFALSRFCRQPLTKLEHVVVRLLRLGAYQILCLDRVPDRAAVHETVELTRRLRLERATGLINGILRSLVREQQSIPWPAAEQEPAAYLEHVLSLPGWLARQWLAEFGTEEAQALAAAMLEPAPFSLRVNTLATSRAAYLEKLTDLAEARPTRFAPEGLTLDGRGRLSLPGDREGWYQVQDEASMLIPHLLAPQPGDRILDACAAPGGKTTQLAALAGNQAKILALDLHPQRVRLITQGAARLGCRGIEARPWDLTKKPEFLAPASFDRVLVDAPCSGLGVLRRNPEIRWRRAASDLPRLAELQRAILQQVAPLVRPGGALVYSLCTLGREETTGVVEAFAAAHPDFVLENLRPLVPAHWAELIDAQGFLRTLPHRHDGMDAFFAARFRRTER